MGPARETSLRPSNMVRKMETSLERKKTWRGFFPLFRVIYVVVLQYLKTSVRSSKLVCVYTAVVHTDQCVGYGRVPRCQTLLFMKIINICFSFPKKCEHSRHPSLCRSPNWADGKDVGMTTNVSEHGTLTNMGVAVSDVVVAPPVNGL